MNQPSPRPTLAEVGEFALIESITAGLPANDRVLLGPGDDAAALDLASPVLTSIDVLVEGVHFRRDWSDARSVGRKAVAVNVADIEAMGGTAYAIVVGFSAPGDLPAEWALEFAAGLRDEASRAGVDLVGGDLTRARDITIAVTVLGSASGGRIVPQIRRTTRRCGRPDRTDGLGCGRADRARSRVPLAARRGGGVPGARGPVRRRCVGRGCRCDGDDRRLRRAAGRSGSRRRRLGRRDRPAPGGLRGARAAPGGERGDRHGSVRSAPHRR